MRVSGNPSLPSAPADDVRRRRWSAARYGRVLPLTARSRRIGQAYAALVAAVELRLDADRRLSAERRIARWLGVAPDAARRIHRDSLRSEAREEADTTYFMAHPDALFPAFRPPRDEPPHAEPTIYAILHFGSPILAYLYLARMRGIALHAIGRELDVRNPMAEAKRRYGIDKVEWVRRLAGRPFLGVDGAAIIRARELLLAGESIYAAIDVPGDVVARAAEVVVCGERLRVSAGVPTLASLTGAPLRPVVAISHPTHLALHYGARIVSTTPAATLAAVTTELFRFVSAHPGEWWLWPYVTSAAVREEESPAALLG